MIRAPHLFAAYLAVILPATALSATNYHALLKSGSEVPPTGSAGEGSVDATLNADTGKLDYTVTWSGMTGPATMAHFHGPAVAGKNAGVEVTIGGASPASPVHGSATLSPAQVAQLNAGSMYVNVHSAKFPKGEIRGQVVKQ